MNRRDFTRAIATATGVAALSPKLRAGSGTQPNLLFVFPDQMRMHSMGIWSETGYDTLLGTVGDPVHTPHMDQLAKDGVLFTQASSIRPVCSPYRAMLMSGMYSERNGVDQNCYVDRNVGLRNDIVGFTDVLSTCGYETGYVGKVHWEKNVKYFDAAGNYIGPGGTHSPHPYDTYIPPGPGRHGNSFWVQNLGTTDGIGSSSKHKNSITYASRSHVIGGKADGAPHREYQFTPEQEADIVIDYINNTNGERDITKPFSMFWAPNPPHSPYSTLEDVDQAVHDLHYKNKTLAQLALRPNYVSNASKQDTYIRYYYSLVTSIDEHLGRILQALESSGEASNTIVVFTSDHGELMGSQNKTGKNQLYDEAYLVPFIICYPGQTTHRIEDLMITPVDLMPTLLGMMGLNDQVPLSVQGVDYSHGILTGDFSSQPKPASAPYFKGTTAERGIRTADYVYMVTDAGVTRLHNLTTDPYQMTNLTPGSIPPADLAFLKSELGYWLKKAEDIWYINNLQPGLVTYPPGDNFNMKTAGAEIQFDVPKDGTVYVEASTNLVEDVVVWEPVGTNTSPSWASRQAHQMDTSLEDHRYYRVRKD